MTTFVVYSRRGCDLCDDMIEALEMLLHGRRDDFDVVDVDTDAALKERYGLRVPVLVLDDEELCFGHLDADRVRQALEA